jgi:hypothetical protein
MTGTGCPNTVEQNNAADKKDKLVIENVGKYMVFSLNDCWGK